MSYEVYVDYDSGNDGNAGAIGTPVKHLSVALTKLNDPLDADGRIYLKGTLASPQDYGGLDGSQDKYVDFSGLDIDDGISLTVQAEDWDEDSYEEGESPYTNGTSFDPAGDKPVAIPRVILGSQQGIVFKGVEFGPAEDVSNDEAGVALESQGSAEFIYCKAFDFKIGFEILSYSLAFIENCGFQQCVIGALGKHDSRLLFKGGSSFVDCVENGLFLFLGSRAEFDVWSDLPTKYFTSKFYSTETPSNYAAMKALVNSTIWIGDTSILPEYESSIAVKILNEDSFKADNYFGVVLGYKSMIAGSECVSFDGKDSEGNLLNNGMDTVVEDQQFVTSDDSTVA